MNSLYQSYQKTQERQGPPSNLNELLQNVASQFVPVGMTPEQMVRQMIQNGQMSQEQFAQYSAIADRWTGKKR